MDLLCCLLSVIVGSRLLFSVMLLSCIVVIIYCLSLYCHGCCILLCCYDYLELVMSLLLLSIVVAVAWLFNRVLCCLLL